MNNNNHKIFNFKECDRISDKIKMCNTFKEFKIEMKKFPVQILLLYITYLTFFLYLY